MLRNKSISLIKKLIVFFLISLLLSQFGYLTIKIWKPAMMIYLIGYMLQQLYIFDLDYEDDFIVETGTYNYGKNTPYHPPGAGYLSAHCIHI